MVTILWDKDGKRYNHGVGFYVLIDGKEKIKMNNLPEKPGVVALD
jgi:hypothetical protein